MTSASNIALKFSARGQQGRNKRGKVYYASLAVPALFVLLAHVMKTVTSLHLHTVTLTVQVDYPKESDMVELFECEKTQTNRYRFFLRIYNFFLEFIVGWRIVFEIAYVE